MSIGAIIPGDYITITPDTISGLPSSLKITPSPTMLVTSVDVQRLTLHVMSADKYLLDFATTGLALKANLAGATFTGNVTGVGFAFSSPQTEIHSSRTPPRYLSAGWAYSGTWIDGGTGGRADFEVDVPNAVVLKKIRIWIHPAAHSNLPATPPSAKLSSVNLHTGAKADIGSTVVDGSDLATYQTNHAIEIDCGSLTIARQTYEYYVVFVGEEGTNSASGLELVGPPEFEYQVSNFTKD